MVSLTPVRQLMRQLIRKLKHKDLAILLLALSAPATGDSIDLPPLSNMMRPKLIEVKTTLESVRALAVNPRNDRQVLAASESGKTVMIDINAGQVLWQRDLKANWQYDLRLAYAPDGQAFAAAALDGVPRLIKSATGEDFTALSAPCVKRAFGDRYGAMAFSSDQRLLAAAEFDMSNSHLDEPIHVNIWDTQSGRCIKGFTLNSSEPVDGLSLTSDNSMLVIQRAMGVAIHKIATGDAVMSSLFVSLEEVRDLKFMPFIHKVAVSGDNRYGAIAYVGYTYGGDMRDPQFAVALIDLQVRKRVWLRSLKGGVEDLSFSRDGSEIGFFDLNGIWGRLQTTTGDLLRAHRAADWLSETESGVGSPPPHAFMGDLNAAVTVYSRGTLGVWRFEQ